jgi:catechol 2,3-dioxygenase-like lactoylglutathione lyase family enzyme
LKQSIVHIALVVEDYDDAINFFVNKLKFELIEDTYQPTQDKRWVVVSPPGSSGVTLLLARASKAEQKAVVGDQTGGRVFLFLATDDVWRDYKRMVLEGIKFIRQPQQQEYGNLWDLLELNSDHPMAARTL